MSALRMLAVLAWAVATLALFQFVTPMLAVGASVAAALVVAWEVRDLERRAEG